MLKEKVYQIIKKKVFKKKTKSWLSLHAKSLTFHFHALVSDTICILGQETRCPTHICAVLSSQTRSIAKYLNNYKHNTCTNTPQNYTQYKILTDFLQVITQRRVLKNNYLRYLGRCSIACGFKCSKIERVAEKEKSNTKTA